MDIRHLQHLLAIVEHGSLKRAAEAVNVSQQGLSSSIKSLEGLLGVRLLDRGRNGAVPTAAGRTLVGHARQIVGQVRLARAEVRSLAATESGTAVMGTGPFFAQRVVPAAIGQLVARRPNLSVQVHEGTADVLCPMLLDGRIDFAVSTPSASFELSADLEQTTLFEDVDVPQVNPQHPLARKRDATLRDLAAFPWISSSRFPGDRERVLKLFVDHGVTPPSRFILTDSAVIITELLRDRDYVHVSGRSFFAQAFSNVTLVPLELPEFRTRRVGVILTRRGGHMAPASRALLEAFDEAWQQASRTRRRNGPVQGVEPPTD